MTTPAVTPKAESTPIPDNLPSIGKATLALLRSKGVETARDVYDRGAEGHAHIPGLGPAKWAVLKEWMWSALTFEERVAIVIRASQPLPERDGFTQGYGTSWDEVGDEADIEEPPGAPFGPIRTYPASRLLERGLTPDQHEQLAAMIAELNAASKAFHEHFQATVHQRSKAEFERSWAARALERERAAADARFKWWLEAGPALGSLIGMAFVICLVFFGACND